MSKRAQRVLQDTLAYAPKALRSDRAAAYLGMSESFFLSLVRDKLMPTPVKIKRVALWDRAELDRAFDALKQAPTMRRNTADIAMGITTDDD